MPVCKLCNRDKEHEEFYKHCRTQCKQCYNDRQKRYYANNREYRKAYQKGFYKENKEYHQLQNALRNKRVRNATPLWFDEFDLLVLTEARDLIRLWKVLGIEFHLDHIVPIKGRQVCGLHYHKNWQLLTAEENRRKSNQFIQE